MVVGGDLAFQITANPSGNPGVEFATKQYVDQKSINDLATQSNSYNAHAFKFTNISDPADAQDLATKQYVDQQSAIGEGIADATISTSTLLANQSSVTNGTTPLNMNNKRIIAIDSAADNGDALSRQTADSKYY